MAERPDSFLSRWSRRKREPEREERDEAAAVTGAVTGAAEAAEAAEAVEADGSATGDPAMGDPEVVAKLPDIDSLDETSDFTPFMAEGVPEILRRRALRKLWRLNPVFAHLDGLNDYDQDFTDAAMVLPNLKTIYKVGKGMLGEPEAEPQAAPADSDAGPADPGAGPSDPGAGKETGVQMAAAGEPQPPPGSVPPESSPPESLTESPPESPVESSVESPPPQPAPREAAAPAVTEAAASAESAAPSGPRRRRAESRRWGESSE
jgi:hypothetical protein